MVFSSAVFLYFFLPAVFILHRISKNRTLQNIILASASIVFYAFGQLNYVPLFLVSVFLNYICGLILIQISGETGRKAVLAVAVVLNIGILAVFKYTDFILSNINLAFRSDIPLKGIVLPIGISFFTFQGMSYVIDVYRHPESGSRNLLKILLYISFFPQLIAGPIVKYHDVEEQIDHRVTSPEESAAGMRRFVRGLSKKLLIANTAGAVVDSVFAYVSGTAGLPDMSLAWLAAVCYMLQIYYDFSGYSDMAIGLGRMFGFRFLENFNFPYGSASIREFWRRWHISLSSWFREYLYIPLGGNRKGNWRTALNRLIVFLCTGIWHGANWTFIFWGLCHGLLSSLENLRIIPVERLTKSRSGRCVSRIYTLLAVCLLFVIFRADTLGQGFRVIGGMFAWNATPEGTYLAWKLFSVRTAVIAAIGILFAGNLIPKLRSRLAQSSFSGTAAFNMTENLVTVVLAVLCMLALSPGGYNPFIYFQF